MIKKSNKLINARFFLPLSAQKLVLLCALKLDEKNKDSHGRYYADIVADELNEITGNQNKYEDLRISADKLTKATFYIRNEYGDDYIENNWVGYAHYFPSEARVRIVINQDADPFLINIKEKATQFSIDITKAFHYKYTLRIFELLIQHINDQETHYEIYFSVEEFRELLMLENKHKSFGDLNRYVLKKSVLELNETELENVICKQDTIGNKTVGIVFIFDVNISDTNLYNSETLEKFS